MAFGRSGPAQIEDVKRYSVDFIARLLLRARGQQHGTPCRSTARAAARALISFVAPVSISIDRVPGKILENVTWENVGFPNTVDAFVLTPGCRALPSSTLLTRCRAIDRRSKAVILVVAWQPLTVGGSVHKASSLEIESLSFVEASPERSRTRDVTRYYRRPLS